MLPWFKLVPVELLIIGLIVATWQVCSAPKDPRNVYLQRTYFLHQNFSMTIYPCLLYLTLPLVTLRF